MVFDPGKLMDEASDNYLYHIGIAIKNKSGLHYIFCCHLKRLKSTSRQEQMGQNLA
jgi:hypothetical protein